jgi:hypothetical protein
VKPLALSLINAAAMALIQGLSRLASPDAEVDLMALRYTPEMRLARALSAALTLACSARSGFAASGCKPALAQLAVCETAIAFAIDAMRSRRLEAASVMQDLAMSAGCERKGRPILFPDAWIAAAALQLNIPR